MDPVIVVGAGPVGLSLSLALAGQGVPSVLLDEGPGKDEPRPARTVVLHADTAAMAQRLGCTTLRDEGAHFAAWRTLRRRQQTHRSTFEDHPAPLHVPQHALARGLRDAAAAHPLVQLVPDSRLDSLEQEAQGVTVHTRGAETTWWRGSWLVGCDGARSTVRKLLGIRFPGRTAVERHAVAALRTELPWPGEALLHRGHSSGVTEVTARPLPDGVWRLDWLLPPRGDLVTPDALIALIRETLAGWCGGTTPPYDLIDTGVYTVHHRLARSWREGRAFLAGDAAHLLGAVGTQGVEEGLRDVENLAWKLALAWHHGASEGLLDSYQAERRTAVAARLRAADQALPVLRGGGGLRSYLPGSGRTHELLLAEGHLGRGPLGSAPAYAPPVAVREVPTDTEPGGAVANVPVTAPDGSTVPLRDLLGSRLLVVLVAPGTGVWDRRHWMKAGLMPRLAAAVSALPVRAELLVADGYPGAPAHTVLLVRPDGHLAATFAGVRPAELYEAADAVRAGAPGGTGEAGAKGAAGSGTAAGESAGKGAGKGAGEGAAAVAAVPARPARPALPAAVPAAPGESTTPQQ
ncbi:monooxygenase [Streptomyces venezuelae]|uniref:Monooxygenase n=1 Tax=Streptomyces venezuelae TaxID=54571 RepID=A0A5P2D3K5_STRVZ|nr:FAD-dependent monooxygenase [Streptomyces venezuelae]QES47891.1 monooxygenase [Streptomyces venezuelae]